MAVVDYRYRAFISYSHRDQAVARWLHGALESYRVPQRLVGRETTTGVIARRVGAIFRDRDELPVASDLSGKINDALAATQFLIVLCSPASAQSKWVNQEVINFKRLKGEDSIIAVIIGGEPFASAMPGREAEECFVPALRFRVAADGALSAHPAEPIAADLRPDKDSKRLVKLKVLAGLLGLGLDELVRRENQRRTQRLFWLSSGMAAAMVAMGVLTIFAIQSRNEAVIARDDAERQKSQAEDLIEFMLGDLRSKLQPVGRLDVLDSVAEKSLAYFASLKPSEVDGNTLGRKARSLHLLGEIQDLRGDVDGAMKAFKEARETTSNLLEEDPENEQRIYEHAQSEYWIGYEFFNKGSLPDAEQSVLRYKSLTERLVAKNPGNKNWQTERGHSEINIGAVRMQQGNFSQAIENFQQARDIFKAIADANPGDIESRILVARSYSWLASANMRAGKLDAVELYRKNEVDIYDSLAEIDPKNKDLSTAKLNAYRALARIFSDKGDDTAALSTIKKATALAEGLQNLDPENTLWTDLLGRSLLDTAEILIEEENFSAARPLLRRGARIAADLLKLDSQMLDWKIHLDGRASVLAAQIGRSASEDRENADKLKKAIASLQQLPDEQRARPDVFSLLAHAYLIAGDTQSRLNNLSAATALWNQGERHIQARGTNIPTASKIDLALLYDRLGRTDDAQRIARDLIVIGYAPVSITRIVK